MKNHNIVKPSEQHCVKEPLSGWCPICKKDKNDKEKKRLKMKHKNEGLKDFKAIKEELKDFEELNYLAEELLTERQFCDDRLGVEKDDWDNLLIEEGI